MDVVNLTGEVVASEGFSVDGHVSVSFHEAEGVGFSVHGAGAVDFSVSVGLVGLGGEDELAPPPLPLPVHLPPEDRVTSTQFFWSLTGTV